MEKYSGCNIVESNVKAAPKPAVKKRFPAFLIRLAVSAVIIGVVCFAAFAPVGFAGTMAEELRRIFCFDFFGRSDFGGMPIFSGWRL